MLENFINKLGLYIVNLVDSKFTEAYLDIKTSFINYYLWVTLGWYDVLARYRRSTLGPIWITLSMLVTIGTMGPLYGSLFQLNLGEFIPHLTLGMIFWMLISISLNEFCSAFIESQNYLKQVKMPLSVFVLRVLYRQFIIFCHNIAIYPIVIFVAGMQLNWNILWFFPAFFILLVNLYAMGMVISIFCTRYRDMTPVIASLMQLMFFVTPIIWSLEQLPENRRFLAAWNPFGILLDLVRQPLLGIMPTSYNWIVGITLAVVGLLIAFFVLAKTRRRVTYWL
ncbi:MAG: ABC transporter permease [Neisseriaceae bacterium]|nr:MAG: ABC transporter permease [Neisseriaceae bacterium]